MSKPYNNPGNVDVEKAAASIVAAGGGRTEQDKGDHIHKVAYSRDENRHLSWDESKKDGSVSNVHTDRNNSPYTNYGNNR